MGSKSPDSKEIIQLFLGTNNSTIVVMGEFINVKSKIACQCSKCSYSWETYSPTLKKLGGCPSCNGRVLKSLDELQGILDEKGKSFKILSQPTRYTLEVECLVCNYTWETKRSNVLVNGCASCSKKVKSSVIKVQSKLDAQNRNITVSGNYKNAHTKLDCICAICAGEWSAHAANLLHGGKGCPSCARTGFDSTKPGYLYYLRVVDLGQTYWKIGITNLGVRERFPATDRKKITTLYCHKFENGANAQLAERNILNLFKEYKAHGLRILRAGNTELFTKDVLQMDHLFWGLI